MNFIFLLYLNRFNEILEICALLIEHLIQMFQYVFHCFVLKVGFGRSTGLYRIAPSFEIGVNLLDAPDLVRKCPGPSRRSTKTHFLNCEQFWSILGILNDILLYILECQFRMVPLVFSTTKLLINAFFSIFHSHFFFVFSNIYKWHANEIIIDRFKIPRILSSYSASYLWLLL